MSLVFFFIPLCPFYFAIILKGMSKLVTLLILSYRCIVTIKVLRLLCSSAVCDCGIF